MKKGFTLVEYLVTFGIIILIVGIISITFIRRASTGQIMQTAAQQIATDLRYASELAVATQIRHVVRFNPAVGHYTLVALEMPERMVKEVLLDPTIELSSITLSSNMAEFNSVGAVSTAGLITIRHQDGTTRTINIRPSGYVRIE